MPTTHDDLKEAFAGESQAYQKYLAFAKKAERDGFLNIARLFRTTAEAERIHAEGHLKALEHVGATLQNLQAAIDGETYEFTKMYPPMLDQANKENHKGARMFKYAVGAEEVHAKLYSMALQAVKDGKDLAISEFYLCPVCGYIELGAAPEKCPICGALASKFVKVAYPS
ncbi:MAG: rubrerythrin family protein [bacterium]